MRRSGASARDESEHDAISVNGRKKYHACDYRENFALAFQSTRAHVIALSLSLSLLRRDDELADNDSAPSTDGR